jgi:hypothetical protein
MLRQLGWGQDYPYPAAPLRRRGGIGRPRWRLLAVTSLAVVVVGFLAGLTGTIGGRIALGLAVVVVGLLGAHHAGGGVRWLARAVAEYTIVAVLVALLAAHYGPHSPPAAKQPAAPRPAAAAPARPRAAPCPAPSQVRAWITCVWHAAMDPAPTPPTTPKPR